MVLIPASQKFCIDKVEVTQAQYKAFLDANPSVQGTSPACSFKTSHTPAVDPTATPIPCLASTWDPGTKGSLPVTCIDWCDADAFCRWQGKRLCGKVGGGSTPYGDPQNAAADQWTLACTEGGLHKYPYGGTFLQDACNGKPKQGAGSLKAVGSYPQCEGGYAGLFDMNGNAIEWQDACELVSGPTDRCWLRGGSFYDTPSTYLVCNGAASNIIWGARGSVWGDVGFRCCGGG